MVWCGGGGIVWYVGDSSGGDVETILIAVITLGYEVDVVEI